ncbi:hypothetical protein MHU86_25708 [Fragilaria crotonensis]|nr:hypothetical protein MHU86_25708 [Fragilaria crotonensis]
MSNKTKNSLPRDVHEMAVLRNEVIAWTSLDPEVGRDLGTSALCQSIGAFLILPCFWPHLLLRASTTSCDNEIRNQYWILTETELKVVDKDHEDCCIPGCCTSGDSVRTIPLDSITDCKSDDARNGCGSLCCTPMSTVRVYSKGPYGPVGKGLAHRDWFVHELLNRRDIINGKHSLNACCEGEVVATPAMERGGSARSATDRMKDVTELYLSGVLTSDEFLEKKKEIIGLI